MASEMNTESQELLRALLRRIAVTHPMTQQDNSPECATDDEVRDFIRIFMKPQKKHNKLMTSYGLKHAAERTIGYVFHGASHYCYVSNEQFKRVMREEANACLFNPKKESGDSPNDVYTFRWSRLAMLVFNAFGVYGCRQEAIRNTEWLYK